MFGDFTGHLDRISRVTFVNDEARSYIARHQQRFDIIQVSLIDTWAATAAGAFVLSENSMYTIEAWKLFLERITRRGVLSFSRWYHRDIPIELYRLTSLAAASLTETGVADPRKHIVIVRHFPEAALVGGIGTLLVSKAPFTAKDLETIEDVSEKLQFQVVLSPRFSLDTTFSILASGKGLDQFTATFPYNITPTTDNSPFFFQMSRLRDVSRLQLRQLDPGRYLTSAVLILGVLLITVLLLTGLVIFVPLWLVRGQAPLRDAIPLLLFFSAIGFGYMLVEISQMQRLIVFLGHPTYSLSVVLFTLLLSSGVGSFLTGKLQNPDLERSGQRRLLLLLCTLVLFGLLTPQFIGLFHGSVTPVRILVATAIPVPDRAVHGDGLSTGNEGSVQGICRVDTLAVGDQRSCLGMRLGACGRDRPAVRHFQGLLERLCMVLDRVSGLRLDRANQAPRISLSWHGTLRQRLADERPRRLQSGTARESWLWVIEWMDGGTEPPTRHRRRALPCAEESCPRGDSYRCAWRRANRSKELELDGQVLLRVLSEVGDQAPHLQAEGVHVFVQHRVVEQPAEGTLAAFQPGGDVVNAAYRGIGPVVKRLVL